MSAAGPALPLGPALGERLQGTPLLLFLDVDGTLAPITPTPEAAMVPPDTRRIVAALASRSTVKVALVSGRAAADARRVVSVSNVWVIGNHGFEIVGPDGEDFADPALARHRGAVAEAARRLRPLVAPIAGTKVEDKGLTLSVHHRLAEPSVVPRLRRAVEDVGVALGLKLTEGKKVLELRPPARIDKGTAVLTLALALGGLGPQASAVYVGDDVSDEDAMRALRSRTRRAVTVRVADEPATRTSAEFTVRELDEVRRFLDWLLELRPR